MLAMSTSVFPSSSGVRICIRAACEFQRLQAHGQVHWPDLHVLTLSSNSKHIPNLWPWYRGVLRSKGKTRPTLDS